MVKAIHICTGSRGESHEPTVMEVDSNSVDVYRLPDDTLRLTEGRGWTKLASEMGANDFDGLKRRLDQEGGDYYGCADRYVCPICGATIVWRV